MKNNWISLTQHSPCGPASCSSVWLVGSKKVARSSWSAWRTTETCWVSKAWERWLWRPTQGAEEGNQNMYILWFLFSFYLFFVVGIFSKSMLVHLEKSFWLGNLWASLGIFCRYWMLNKMIIVCAWKKYMYFVCSSFHLRVLLHITYKTWRCKLVKCF